MVLNAYGYTVKTDTLYNSKILYSVRSICTNVHFGLSSLQQKFSLTSNNLGTNNVVVKRVDCSSS